MGNYHAPGGLTATRGHRTSWGEDSDSSQSWLLYWLDYARQTDEADDRADVMIDLAFTRPKRVCFCAACDIAWDYAPDDDDDDEGAHTP